MKRNNRKFATEEAKIYKPDKAKFGQDRIMKIVELEVIITLMIHKNYPVGATGPRIAGHPASAKIYDDAWKSLP